VPRKSTADRALDLAGKIATFGGIGLLTWLAETGADGGAFQIILKMAQSASPFAAAFAVYAWREEVRKRDQSNADLNERTLDFANTTHEGFAALRDIGIQVTELRRASEALADGMVQELLRQRGDR